MADPIGTLPRYHCVRLGDCPFSGQPFAQLRANEKALLSQGLKVRVIVFDLPKPLIGVAFFDRKQHAPSPEQITRIYRNMIEGTALMTSPTGGTA